MALPDTRGHKPDGRIRADIAWIETADQQEALATVNGERRESDGA